MSIIQKIKSYWKQIAVYFFITSGLVSVFTAFFLQQASVKNHPPVAIISQSSREGAIPHVVSFDSASSYDPEGANLLFFWRVDDQLVSQKANFNYLFKAVGINRVELIVKDNVGAASKTSVFIKNNEPDHVNSLLEAFQHYQYEVAWLGPNVHKLNYYPVTYSTINNRFILIIYNYKDGKIYAVVTEIDHRLLGVWRDGDGEGFLDLVFNEDFSQADGWWTYGADEKKYKFVMRRVART